MRARARSGALRGHGQQGGHGQARPGAPGSGAGEEASNILYEGSVGGGIPIIAPLKRDLLANEITAVPAIINGTTNYILTSMSKEGSDFAEALRRAQALGYAEADPTNDIEGIDAAYKLSILSSLAFRTTVTPDQVHREGITRLSAKDFRYAAEMGYAIKLLAVGKRRTAQSKYAYTRSFCPRPSRWRKWTACSTPSRWRETC